MKNLHKSALRLPQCHDYFTGRRTFDLELPNNIISFYRLMLLRRTELRQQHHRFVLIMNLKTSGRLCLNNRTIALRRGQAILIFPHQFHRFLTLNIPLRWLFITFELKSYDVLMPLYNSPVPFSRWACQLADDLVKLYVARRPESETAARMALTLGLLLYDLLPPASAPVGSGRANSSATANSLMPDKVNQYICANLERPCAIKDIARALGIGSSHLRLLFRKRMFMSLGKYVRTVKLDKAMELLGNTQLPIKTVAMNIGYASVTSFTHMFRHHTGVSPSRYRLTKATRRP